MVEVQTTVRSKEFWKVKDLKINDNGEGLSDSKGRIECKWMSKSKRFDKSRVKYFNCKKNHSLQRDCPMKKGNDDSTQTVVSSDEDNYESVVTLVVSSLETKEG